jgi:hypothetical protein
VDDEHEVEFPSPLRTSVIADVDDGEPWVGEWRGDGLR